MGFGVIGIVKINYEYDIVKICEPNHKVEWGWSKCSIFDSNGELSFSCLSSVSSVIDTKRPSATLQ